jgi:uncharacterized protein (TIGR02246 family)
MKAWIAASLLMLLAAAPVAAGGNLQEDLISREKALWTAWGKGDGEVFHKQLSKDAVQIVAGVGKITGRDAIIAEVKRASCELKSFAFSDVTLRRLAPSVVALTYKAAQDATCEGTKLPPTVYSTSIYVRKKGKWVATSYQETPVD